MKMTSTIEESPSVGGGASLPSKPSTLGDFVYCGYTLKVFKDNSLFYGVIETMEETPFPVVHWNGTYFRHRQSLITTAKTVIRWRIKFGNWRLPK